MYINMGVGRSDAKAKFSPREGISREYGRQHVTRGRVYDARQALEQAIADKEVAEINQ